MSKDTEFLGPNHSFTYPKYVLNCSGQAGRLPDHSFSLGCSLVPCASVECGADAHVDPWACTVQASVEGLTALLRPLKDNIVNSLFFIYFSLSFD